MLVGLERERRKDRNEDHAAAGLRTFAITTLPGYVSRCWPGLCWLASHSREALGRRRCTVEPRQHREIKNISEGAFSL